MTHTISSELEKAFNEKEGRFSDLAYYIDKATKTGPAFGTTPFSEIYLKDLLSFIAEREALAERRGREAESNDYCERCLRCVPANGKCDIHDGYVEPSLLTPDNNQRI